MERENQNLPHEREPKPPPPPQQRSSRTTIASTEDEPPAEKIGRVERGLPESEEQARKLRKS